MCVCVYVFVFGKATYVRVCGLHASCLRVSVEAQVISSVHSFVCVSTCAWVVTIKSGRGPASSAAPGNASKLSH